MTSLDYNEAHAWAMENMQKVSMVIPKNLLTREENLLSKFVNSKRNPVNNLRNLYDFMDKLSSYVHKITPCHKGCGNCCHINVSISELEASFIAEESNQTIARSTQTLKRDFHGQPCPF